MELKEVLYLRNFLLEDNQVISRNVASFTRQIIDLILERKPDVTQGKAEMFFTHLAMAGKRAEEKTVENPIDAMILEGIKVEAVYPEAMKLRDEVLMQTDIEFPETEKNFLLVHLCNLLV